LTGVRVTSAPGTANVTAAGNTLAGGTAFTVVVPATTSGPIPLTITPNAAEVTAVSGLLNGLLVVNTATGMQIPCSVAGSQLQCTAAGPGQFVLVISPTAQASGRGPGAPAPITSGPQTTVGSSGAAAVAPAAPVAAPITAAAVPAQAAVAAPAAVAPVVLQNPPALPRTGSGGLLPGSEQGAGLGRSLSLLVLALLAGGWLACRLLPSR